MSLVFIDECYVIYKLDCYKCCKQRNFSFEIEPAFTYFKQFPWMAAFQSITCCGVCNAEKSVDISKYDIQAGLGIDFDDENCKLTYKSNKIIVEVVKAE